jgi:hypothetical protein
LAAVKDKGTGAENLIWLASRQSGRAHASSLAADDILAALTGRIAELEARVLAILAEVEPEPPRVDSGSGRDPSASKADAGRGTDKMTRDARVEADDELTRASEERRMLATEMRLLREAFQEARHGPPFAGTGANVVGAPISPDLRTAIAGEMRSLLTELFADYRSRAAAPPPAIEHAAAKSETEADVVAEAHEAILEEIVEDAKTASPPADAMTEAAPVQTFESIVEDVDEFVSASKPFVNDYVEELREPEPIAPADVFPVEALPTEPAAGIVEEYVEEFLQPESPPSETIDLAAALPESALPVVDEPVFGPVEPVAPIVDDYVEELRMPDAPSLETVELSAASGEQIEPIVDEYVEELRMPDAPPFETIEPGAALAEPIEPIADDYLIPTRDVPVTPSAPPPPPDARIAALWEAASSPTAEPETAPPPQPDPAPTFIAEEFVAETRSLEVPEAASAPEALIPEPPVEYASEPPIEFAPEPQVEFAPEPPAIVEPEPETRSEPLITEPAPQETFVSPFPELRTADERGLHQIQVVISPIHSFPRLLETERRIRMLSTVNALHLRDYRNGVATLTVSVAQAISPAEFGAVIQMLESLHLRLEGTTQTSVELRAEDESPTS